MIILEAFQIKHYVKDRLLFDIEQLKIHNDDRIGLVGPNGCGKTTLLNILAKKQIPESGIVKQYTRTELLPQLKRTNTTKSGGEVTQQYINDALLKAPELLLADEPTTNLDTDHIEWLEKKLLQWKGAFVIVSHDRTFLDTVCTSIWEIRDGKLNVYHGNYSDYEQQKNLEKQSQQLAYEKYEQKKKQLEDAIKMKEQKAQRATKKPKQLSASEAKITGAKPYFAKKQKKLQKTAKALETRLEKLEKVEKIKDIPPLKMDIPNNDLIKNRVIIRAEDVSFAIGERVLWKKASFQVRSGDKLAIIGVNGSGKTTLVKQMMNKAEGFTLSGALKIGYFSQNLNILDVKKSILENVKSTSNHDETLIRIVLARLHFFRDDVFKLVEVLSGGERVKVALAKIFLSNVNTLILDEPTNFLDVDSISALESLLKEYEGTIIFVSHDRRFISNIATRILEIRDQEITVFNGTYDQYKQIEQDAHGDKNEQILILEMKISEILSRLSIEPSEELEQQFQQLLAEKRKLQ